MLHAARTRSRYGLEPTYEGLKLAQGLPQVLSWASLEPTYEGLKLDLPMAPPSPSMVWSLPMRD